MIGQIGLKEKQRRPRPDQNAFFLNYDNTVIPDQIKSINYRKQWY